MSHVIHLAQAALDAPGGPILQNIDSAIRTDAVYVVYTSIDDTLAAARVAANFAEPLGVPVTLIHFRTVPFALPVDEPTGMSPVETDEFRARLHAEGLDLHVRVHLCRDGHRAVPSAFGPHSLIVIAGRRRWWPTASERWRRTLEAAGHFVVFVDKSGYKEQSHA